MRAIAFLVSLFAGAIFVVGTPGALAADRQAERGRTVNLVEALEVAYLDFQEQLNQGSGGNPELVAHFADITNYKFSVYEKGGTAIIEITALPLKSGDSIRGGGGKYVVELRSQKILSFELYR